MTVTDAALRDLLRTRSPTEVAQELRAQGYVVSDSRCQTIRSRLIAEGCAEPLPAKTGTVGGCHADPAAGAAKGSAKLHAATVAMFERKAKRKGVSVNAAGMATLYSEAQIAKMLAGRLAA